MIRKKIKLMNKIMRHHDLEIMFGILSGAGLVFLMTSLAKALTILLPKLEQYSFVVYIMLFFVTFIPILIVYTRKGWFRTFYLITALFLFAAQIYGEIFG